MEPSDVNLYLVGFMGTGKTTVGRMVAHKLGFAFLDSDHEIEHAERRSISQIFAESGEPAFRAMEREFIERGHPAARQVVACGGGLVVQPGMLELLKSRGVLICLHAPVETILERTSRNQNRPLINVDDREARVRELFAQREPVYRRAGTTVLTDVRPLREIGEHVLRVYRREARDFARAAGRRPGAVGG
jgi:shikimate kinase